MSENEPLVLGFQQHIDYVVNLNKHTQDYEYWLTEHLRLNGLYWGLTSLFILNSPDSLNRKEMVEFVIDCIDPISGGIAAFPKHDGHMLSTLSGLQILFMLDSLNELTKGQRLKIINFIKGNQLPDGSFQGDKFGEVDTRFVYNGISSLSILGELTDEIVNPAVEFVLKCQNFDGGFGLVPGSESHSAQIFTCLGTLAITNKLDLISKEKQELLSWWLCERQQDFYLDKSLIGGLNGRPEKLPDVCYSWWVLSSLSILKKTHWIDGNKLTEFILKSQDLTNGGISDRPNNQCDVYHTCFGLAGLSLLNYNKEIRLLEIDPAYCMPTEMTKNLKKWKSL